MKQADYIKQMAKLALANDNARLLDLLYQFVEYSQENNRGKAYSTRANSWRPFPV